MARVVSYFSVVCILFQFFWVDQSWAATRVRGFPVRLDGAADVAPPLAVDMDRDGRLELVVATRNQLFVLEADGSNVAGFPVTFDRAQGVGTPLAVGYLGPAAHSAKSLNKKRNLDTDDSGKNGKLPSIVFGSPSGSVVVIEADGKMRSGFPYSIKSPLGGAPSLVDMNNDGIDEIVFGTHDGRLVALDGSGRVITGFPYRIKGSVSTAVTVGRFEPGGPRVLFFGDDSGAVHALGPSGRELSGFPYLAKFTVSNQVVLGDVDDDGKFELVFGSMDYKIHVVESDGKPSKGFPVDTGYRIYSSCALSDLNGDGVVDIIASSGDGKLYAFGAGGKSIRGFPVKVGSRLRGSPVVSDVDLDGKMEIAVGSDRNRLLLVRYNGRTYPGFPARMRDKVVLSPLMADLTGNGLNEIIALSKDGTLMAFRMLRKGKGRAKTAWQAEGRDPERSGFFHPNPPRYVDLDISPESPATTDSLKLSYRFFDMDGDDEPNTLIRWFRNGKPIQELDGKREVAAKYTGKHQRWHFVLQADPKQRRFSSKPVTISNTAPEAPSISLLPKHARTGDDLHLKIAKESKDADGDKVRYRITWLKDRSPQKRLKKDFVRSRLTAKDQRWTVVVVPFDGEVTGAPARTSLVVENTPPGPARISLVPATPSVTDPVSVKVIKPGRDADGDKVTYFYRWLSDENELNLPESDSTMPERMVRKHQKLEVEVTSFDGLERGEKTSAKVQVVNSVPSAPVVKIVPSSPGTLDDLRAMVIAPSQDADLDVVRYRFSWSRQDEPYNGQYAHASILPASQTKKNEKWSVMVIANDGEQEGKPGVASIQVTNTIPVATHLEQVNPMPYTDEKLVVKSSGPPTDPDGDPTWYEVVWRSESKVLARGKDAFSLDFSRTKKHKRYEAVLTPKDSDSSGVPVHLWFEVKNSPPGICKVHISPSKPGTGDSLKANVDVPSKDKDGDKVEYGYRWYKNGIPLNTKTGLPSVEGTKVTRGATWTVVATPSDGESFGKPCTDSVTVKNSAPDTPVARLYPPKPTVLDQLELRLQKRPVDKDGDRVKISVRWKVDGRLFAITDDKGIIPKGILKKGQRWSAQLVASDGELMSKPSILETRISNYPPSVPKLSITPHSPLSSDDLRCRLSVATMDPDGDILKYRYKWYQVKKKGQDLTKLKPVSSDYRLDAKYTRKGQLWECVAQAFDGELWGKPGVDLVRIGNAAPDKPVVRLVPPSPRANQELRCLIEKPAKDPDGDKVHYRFTWFKDGVKQRFAPETDRVPVRLTKTDDIWQCRAVAFDGVLAGPAAESEEVLVAAP